MSSPPPEYVSVDMNIASWTEFNNDSVIDVMICNLLNLELFIR